LTLHAPKLERSVTPVPEPDLTPREIIARATALVPELRRNVASEHDHRGLVVVHAGARRDFDVQQAMARGDELAPHAWRATATRIDSRSVQRVPRLDRREVGDWSSDEILFARQPK